MIKNVGMNLKYLRGLFRRSRELGGRKRMLQIGMDENSNMKKISSLALLTDGLFGSPTLCPHEFRS